MRSRISLLPEEFKRRNKLKKQMYYILTAIASMSIFLALIVTFVVLYRLTLKSNLSSLKEQRQTVKQQISSLQKYEELDKKITTLESLLAKTATENADWRGLLIKFSNAIPGGVNISELSVSNGKEGNALKIRGSSVDNYRVALWIQNLRTICELKNIQCSYSERKKTTGSLFSEYEISATLVSAVPNPPATSKEVKK